MAESYERERPPLSPRKLAILLAQPQLAEFIRRYIPELDGDLDQVPNPSASTGPFLSVITRTQGKRTRTLREALMCLAGQTCRDFQLLLVVHGDDDVAHASVEALVQEFPTSFQQRVAVLKCTRAGRAAPLNDAVAQATGQYVAVLDDDDFVLGQWVETYKALAVQAPGSMLRAACARQEFSAVGQAGEPTLPRAMSWPTSSWPTQYDAIGHLYENLTPFMSVAFPATLFRDLDLRFDECLSTTEDWDFTNRVGMLCGVTNSPQITSIYRWWTNGESSSFSHSSEEWVKNRSRVISKLDSLPVLLPPGSVKRINMLTEVEKGRAASWSAAFQRGIAILKQPDGGPSRIAPLAARFIVRRAVAVMRRVFRWMPLPVALKIRIRRGVSKMTARFCGSSAS